MADNNVILSAIDIKQLFYCDPSKVTGDLTPAMLKSILADSDTKEIINVHQDTWTIEETDASQDSYRNQLNGEVYRKGRKQMGDLSFNFTLGQYDYTTKAAFLGGEATATSWKRNRGAVTIHMCLIALTDDDQYAVLPYADIAGRENTTDGAVGIPVRGSMVSPKNTEIAPEYWFDKDSLETNETDG